MTFRQAGTPVAFLYVHDRDRAIAFYCGALGLEHRSADAHGDFLALDGALVRMTVMRDFRPHPHPVLGWDVADIAAAAEALRRRGVTFELFDGMDQDAGGIWTSPDGATRLAWFADPDGNVLMLSQN